ncbi:alpha/beta fold hydrolase [Burkholderiaceae bacterium DAT-1]|nr:alpha/beta fold hydrolase [Burkholderiaceae bacterium DAT-1]
MSYSLWLTLVLLGICLLLAGLTRAHWPDATLALARRMAGMKRHATGIDGHEVVYYESGLHDAPVVLLLHGFGGDSLNWYRLAKRLRKQYRLIMPDLPGFGETGVLPGKSYAIPAQIQRLKDFVDVLKLGRFHLVGNSMGGYLAAAFAAEFPSKVMSLALFNAAGVDMPRYSPYVQAVLAGDNPLVVRSRKDFERLLALVAHRKAWMPGYLKEFYARERAASADEQEAIFKESFMQPMMLKDKLPHVVAPTLILWGDDDRILDISSIQPFREGLPHAEIAVLPACGHLPMLEKPAETARVWQSFIDRVDTLTTP